MWIEDTTARCTVLCYSVVPPQGPRAHLIHGAQKEIQVNTVIWDEHRRVCVCVCLVCICKWSAHCGGLWAVRVCEPAQLITASRSLSAPRLIKPNNTIGFIGNDCALLQSLHNYWSLIVRLWEHMCTSSIQQNVTTITPPKTSYLKMTYLPVLFCNLTEKCGLMNPIPRRVSLLCMQNRPLPVTQNPNLPHDKTALCSCERNSNHQSFFLFFFFYFQHPCFFIFYKHKHYFNEPALPSQKQRINQPHKKLKSLHREVC